MKFHECISYIRLKGDKDYPGKDAWWYYLWRRLELLHDEDYSHVKNGI